MSRRHIPDDYAMQNNIGLGMPSQMPMQGYMPMAPAFVPGFMPMAPTFMPYPHHPGAPHPPFDMNNPYAQGHHQVAIQGEPASSSAKRPGDKPTKSSGWLGSFFKSFASKPPPQKLPQPPDTPNTAKAKRTGLRLRTILPLIAGAIAVAHVSLMHGPFNTGAQQTSVISNLSVQMDESFDATSETSKDEDMFESQHEAGLFKDTNSSAVDSDADGYGESVSGESEGGNSTVLREVEWQDWMAFPLTIGTAVVSSDLFDFVNWLESIEKLDFSGNRVVPEESVRIVVFDVGLSDYHRNMLAAGIEGVGRARPSSNVVLRSLKKQLSGLGVGQGDMSLLFATRALILASLLDEFGANSRGVVYFDCSTFIQGPLGDVAQKLALDGFVATSYRKSPKRALAEMVHSSMLDAYPRAERWRPVLDGKIIGCDGRNTRAVERILKPWLACVSNWACVSPPGASEENHRYDLASLSVIMYSEGLWGMTKDEHTSVSTAKNTKNLLEEQRRDMWGRVKEMTSSRVAVALTGPTHEAEVAFIKGHITLTIIVAVNSDTEALSHALELVNNIGAKERGTRRGNIVGLGSYERACRIVIYDLGLTDAQAKMLSTGFKESLGENAVIRPFKAELASYPPHCQLADKGHTNAFKAVLLQDAIKQYGGFVLWLDSTDAKGDQIYIKKPLDRARETLMKSGMVTVQSAGSVQARTHPGMLEAFDLADKDDILDLQNLDSRVIGFDSMNETIMETVFKPWVECSLDLMCIAPPGSSRSNHQYEQSALTVIAYSAGITDFPKKKNDIHIDAGSAPSGH